MPKSFGKVREILENVGKIVVVSHRKPDADTLGAAICLNLLLEQWGKKADMVCFDKPSSVFSFLPKLNHFKTEFDVDKYDVMIVVDAGASYMTNFHLKYENFFKRTREVVNIDHHASNDHFGTVNIVDPFAASATVIIYRMLNQWGVKITPDMATCLISGMYGDTGSFMHTNTNEEVYDIAADLMSLGADIAHVSQSLFKNNSVTKLKLWGKVLESAAVTNDNVVMSIVREDDYSEVGARPEELTGVIDYLSMVPDTNFAVLLNEDRHGNVKGSFRTRKEGIDLSRIAAVFGGGGHPKASGFSIPGKLKEEVRYAIVCDDMSKKSLNF